MGDDERVRAARRGDEAAFTELMEEHKARLYRTAYAYLGQEQDALEAVQEVTFRAYAKLRSLKQPDYFGTWVMRILINYCVDEKKRRQKLMPADKLPEGSAATDVAGRVDLLVAIKKLEPHAQKVIFLKYFSDLTLKEIAGVMECPEGTIKTWLHKGLNQMRSFLHEEGYGHAN